MKSVSNIFQWKMWSTSAQNQKAIVILHFSYTYVNRNDYPFRLSHSFQIIFVVYAFSHKPLNRRLWWVDWQYIIMREKYQKYCGESFNSPLKYPFGNVSHRYFISLLRAPRHERTRYHFKHVPITFPYIIDKITNWIKALPANCLNEMIRDINFLFLSQSEWHCESPKGRARL